MNLLQLKQLNLLFALLGVEKLLHGHVLYEQIFCILVEIDHDEDGVGGDLLADPAGTQAVDLLDHLVWTG